MTTLTSKTNKGFTLMETLLAISVVAILITTFLAVFGPATSGIRRAISVEDADRLMVALERELSILHPDEESEFDTAFEKAFVWISGSSDLQDAIILFNYRGDPSQINNGFPEPYTTNGGLPGQDYILTANVGRLSDTSSSLQERMEAIDGRSFAVRMRQLIRNEDGSLAPNDSDDGSLQSLGGVSASTSDDFEDAAIAFQAEFYLMPANSYQYATQVMPQGGNDFSRTLGEPLFTRNMAVRR